MAWYERNPRLSEILDAAATRLDQRYGKAPLLAAGLHQTLGRAYKSSGDYAKAVVQLQAVVLLFNKSLGPGDERSLLAEYELAVMEAHLSRFAQATARLDRADTVAGQRRLAMSELGLRSHLARADLLYQQMQVPAALANYEAADIQRKVLHPADAMLAAHIALSIAGCDLRLQRARQAEQIARGILAGAPYTQQRVGLVTLALARTRLASALRAQGRFTEAIPVAQQSVRDYDQIRGADSQGTITALSALG